MPSFSTNLQSFLHFSALPIEIRLRIWQFASPRRPRVIQVGYDPDKSCWKAWRDGLGGLPSIIHVSKEVREEALKPYSRMFDAYIDPEEDTIFLGDVRVLSYTSAPDVFQIFAFAHETFFVVEKTNLPFTQPMFSIRKPRSIFMSLEYANKLRRVAFTSEIYNGLAQALDQFPSLCEGPATILRRLEGLKHFILALSEDGAGFEYSDDDDVEVEDESLEYEDEDEEEEDWEGDGGEYTQDTSQPDQFGPAGPLTHASGSNNDAANAERYPEYTAKSEDTLDELAMVHQFLDRLDAEAMETMSKGYFRHLGNIHFESAIGHPDHWEAWETYRDVLEVCCEQEKERHPDWIRPKVSVMAVEYGLRRLGDFNTKLHLLGDHSDDVLESDGYVSKTEIGNGSD